jgi:anti-sigma regulatory factor (Ser/Thr protein kinase)
MPTLSCHKTLPGDASAPTHVRTFVQRKLEAFGHPGAVADVQLLASEIVTNAVIHTNCSDCRVHIEIADSVIRVSVSDCDAEHLPYLLPPDPQRFGGLGMHIVDDVARCWGFEADDSGKTVWFEVVHSAA